VETEKETKGGGYPFASLLKKKTSCKEKEKGRKKKKKKQPKKVKVLSGKKNWKEKEEGGYTAPLISWMTHSWKKCGSRGTEKGEKGGKKERRKGKRNIMQIQIGNPTGKDVDKTI